MFRWLSNLFAAKPSRPARGRAVRVLRARYDAAVTNDDNRRHWANADGLSANAANSAEVRRVLRNRARYEVANNSYAGGIVLTLANDVIGTGLANHTTTLADEYARRGLDWEAQLRQRAKELALMPELGLTPNQAAPSEPEETTDDEPAESEAVRAA